MVPRAQAQFAPVVAWDGGRYLVAWRDARVDGVTADLRAARSTPPTVRRGSSRYSRGDGRSGDAVARRGRRASARALGRPPGGREGATMRAARIGLPEFVLAGRIVSAATAQERAPAVAFDGNNSSCGARRALPGDIAGWDLLGMREPRESGARPAGLEGRRPPTPTGAPPRSRGTTPHHLVAMERRAPLGVASVPPVVAPGADSLPAGRCRTTALASGWGDQRAPSVAAGPAGGWWRGDGRSFFRVGRVRRVRRRGRYARGGAFAVSDAVNDQSLPRAACDGALPRRVARGGRRLRRRRGLRPRPRPVLRVHLRRRPGASTCARRVGRPAARRGGPAFAVTAAAGEQTRPRSPRGGRVLRRVGGPPRRRRGRSRRVDRLGRDGGGAEVTISAAPGAQAVPSVAFGGGLFGVAWQDGRVGDGDVYAARVLLTGAVLDPTGLPVATDADESSPAFAPSPGGAGLVAYARFRNVAPVRDRARPRADGELRRRGGRRVSRRPPSAGRASARAGSAARARATTATPAPTTAAPPARARTSAETRTCRASSTLVAGGGRSRSGRRCERSRRRRRARPTRACRRGRRGDRGGRRGPASDDVAITPDAAPAGGTGTRPSRDATFPVEDGASPVTDATPVEDAGRRRRRTTRWRRRMTPQRLRTTRHLRATRSPRPIPRDRRRALAP